MDDKTSVILNRPIPAVTERLSMKLQRITLFGSRARGDFGPDSDIDILFGLDTYSFEAKEQIYDVTIDSSLEYDIVISAIVAGSDQYETLRSGDFLLARDIEREGIELWPKAHW